MENEGQKNGSGTGRWALITGASGGIGLELARLMAADNWNLVLTARSEDAMVALKDELETQFDCMVRVVPADLGTGRCHGVDRCDCQPGDPD